MYVFFWMFLFICIVNEVLKTVFLHTRVKCDSTHADEFLIAFLTYSVVKNIVWYIYIQIHTLSQIYRTCIEKYHIAKLFSRTLR